jgi:hypothetical protein
VVLVDVGKPGGGDGRGGQGGRDGDRHGGQSVLREGLGEEGEEVRAAVTNQAGRRGEGGCVIGTKKEAFKTDVSVLISSWEQLNAGGGGEVMELEVPTGGGRASQEFRDLCGKFNGREGEGVEEDARVRSGTSLYCSFANVASSSPGPIKGRGARRKLFKQLKISFPVIVGDSPLVRQSTNRKRVSDTDRGEGGSAKKLKVWK